MYKLSLNVLPNVYNSLQSSFLSLAWPWSGRSFPRGNQGEWWDPGQGPLSGLGEVAHSQSGTSGSAGTLDWGPMWLGSKSIYHPNAPLMPPTPLLTPQCPWCPYTPASLSIPNTPCWLVMPSEPLYTPAIPQCPTPPMMPYTPVSPNTPCWPVMPSNPPTPLPTSWCPYTSAGSLCHLTPLMAPETPWLHTPSGIPQCTVTTPINSPKSQKLKT